MNRPTKHRFLLFLLILWSVALAACADHASQSGDGKRIPETYYYDANLQFSLEYPRRWERLRVPAERYPGVPYAIRISPPGKKGKAGLAAVLITSIPPAQAKGGYAALQKSYIQGTPGFSMASEKEVELTGTPAWLVEGKGGDRRVQVYLVTSTRRAFILECSVPADTGDEFLPVFEEIVRTFRPLD